MISLNAGEVWEADIWLTIKHCCTGWVDKNHTQLTTVNMDHHVKLWKLCKYVTSSHPWLSHFYSHNNKFLSPNMVDKMANNREVIITLEENYHNGLNFKIKPYTEDVFLVINISS